MSIRISLSGIKKTDADHIRIEYNLTEESGESTTLWYVIPQSYEKYLTLDVADAVVVGILLYAMGKEVDIRSDIPISSNLHFGITKYLMPFLCKINPELHGIKIDLPLSETVYNGKHVGTGISCGVDSLSSVIYHGEEETNDNCRIDTLTLLNTGYYGALENCSQEYRKYLPQSVDFCKEHHYKFFTLDSNISKITHYNFRSANTYLTCSVIMLMQKYFKRYYYSSGYPVTSFKADFTSSARYDVFLLDCISTQSLKFISSCSTMTRVEKTALILRHPSIQKSVFVCTGGNPPVNCCQCEKCVRTMLAIESLGKLDEITFKYDAKAYRKNHIKYVAYMLRHRKSNVFYKEIYESFKANKTAIPLISWICPFPTKFELRKIAGKIRDTKLGEWAVQKIKKHANS